MMMNCFCGMVDRRKAFSLISSRDHCQRSSPSRISDTPRAGFEPAQNLSSGLVESSCAVVITTTPRRHNDTSDVYYFKSPYTNNLSHHIENKHSKFCKDFCKGNFNIKLVFDPFKIKNYFSCNGPIPDYLKSFLVYKYTCASCSSSYIGETFRHLEIRIEEYIKEDNNSHIFKHLQSTTTCFDSYNSLSFKIIVETNSKFNFKIKKALHLYWTKPNLNE